MNVLIVEKENSFCNVITKELLKRKSIERVSAFNTKEELNNCYHLNENDSQIFELGIVDLDFIETDCLDFCKKYSIHNLIGLSANTKTINKFINCSNILRIFKKPLNINDVLSYLDRQYKMTNNEQNQKGLINRLSDLGFNVSHAGTLFLVESINYAIESHVSKTQDIYSVIANKNDTKESVVKWAIYNCINYAYNGDYDKRLEKFLKIYDGRKPTPKYIIEYFVNFANNRDF